MPRIGLSTIALSTSASLSSGVIPELVTADLIEKVPLLSAVTKLKWGRRTQAIQMIKLMNKVRNATKKAISLLAKWLMRFTIVFTNHSKSRIINPL